MEKKNSEPIKRKSMMNTNEEPSDKKICHGVIIEDILAPTEQRNKEILSSHSSIEHALSSDTSLKTDIIQDDNGNNIATTSNTLEHNTSDHVNNTNDNMKNNEMSSNNDDTINESAKITMTTSQSSSLLHSSVGELTNIKLSNCISTEKLIINELSNVRDDKNNGKKIKWKCDRHFSDHGTNSIGMKICNIPIPNIDEPQTSINSFNTLRNKCTYGSKCYRKSSGHKAKFSHPGDSDYDIKDNRPECRYGIKCYRKDPKHKQDFRHTLMRRKRSQTPVRVITPELYESCTDHSSYEESIDESEYAPSGLDCSTDDDDSSD